MQSAEAELIGYYIIKEPTKIDDPQEHAAWYRKIMIQSGEYPVFQRFCNGYRYISIKVNGIICSNYFGAYYYNDEVGQEFTTYMQLFTYELPQRVAGGEIVLLGGES